MALKVIKADKAGFCSGVNGAVNKLIDLAGEGQKGSTLGPLVHNEEVVQYLKDKSILSVEEPEEATGKFIAIRTHGVTPAVINDLQAKEGMQVIDLTCPRVRRVQRIAAKLKEENYNIYILGNKEHPEVVGLVGWAGDRARVFSTAAELEEIGIDEPAALISQTTASPNLFEVIAKRFNKLAPDALVYDTICPETRLRQDEVAELAQRVEALVVVGSKSSANTKALYNICRQLKPTCLANNFRELDRSFLERYSVIGVTAGASTPPWTIKEVVEGMEKENMEVQEEVKGEEVEGEEVEEVEASAVTKEEPAEDVAVESKEEVEEEAKEEVEEETREEAKEETEVALAEEEVEAAEEEVEQFQFDSDIKVAQIGEQVKGKVARVTDEEVFVDIGAKTEAILPLAEIHVPEGQTLKDLFAPEDDLEVTVLEIDEQDGKVVVSHKRLAREKRMQELEEAHTRQSTLEAKVKQVVGAGIVLDLGNGIEGFMPGSLVDLRYIPDFNEFKDQQLQFKILEFDRDKGKLILSRKIILEEENLKAKEETLKAIEVGSTITGAVKRLTDFGAFVDVGGLDGLVHISELSWERVSHPGEVLKVGDQVEVKVLEVIPEKERISLSIRKTQADPWTKAAEDLEPGQIMSGKVTRLVNFGAFIELKPGVEGLAHISQLADYHVKHPSEVLTEGEEVEVKVLEVKSKSKRISLSIKEAGGVSVTQNVTAANGTENGNVTLGDVFGDLFDKEDYQPAESEVEQPAESEEKAEGEES